MGAKMLAIAAVLLSSAAVSRIDAKEVAYPQQAPQFSIAIPETWKPVFRGDSLTLLPIPEDGFVVQVNQQPASAEDLLKELTEKIATQMEVTNVKIGDDSEAENQHDVDCTMMTSVGKSAGVDVVITVVAFSLRDKHFTIQSAGTTELNQKHKGALLGLIDSIKPAAEE